MTRSKRDKDSPEFRGEWKEGGGAPSKRPADRSDQADRKEQADRKDQADRREQVLTKKTPAIRLGITDAVVVLDEKVFLVTRPDGTIPLEEAHGFGLYYHDCRFLRGYDVRLAGTPAIALASMTHHGFKGIFQLTNPALEAENGQEVREETLGLTWERVLRAETLSLLDVLRIENFGTDPAAFDLTLRFDAGFEDVFEVRGLLRERAGTLHDPAWNDDGALVFSYDGADGLERRLTIAFEPQPDERWDRGARFRVDAKSRQCWQLAVTLQLCEAELHERRESRPEPVVDLSGDERQHERSCERWLSSCAEVRTGSRAFERILKQSLIDLYALKTHLHGRAYYFAGIPWFATLFGRDSLLTAMQVLAFDTSVAAETLRLLASYQGRRHDPWRDEEPGKILHELRVGELARMGEIPHTPYYGTIDATLLFLVLLALHGRWTGDLSLFRELRDAADAALAWLRERERAGGGFLTYSGGSAKGLINQGWKDSGDAIVNSDGSLADPPIALVEAQGFSFWARVALASLLDRSGEGSDAATLREEADALRTRFERAFWLPRKGFYALALQKDHRPVEVVSSNPGQALWTGIVSPDRARHVAARLLAPDMYSGWGIRTLSSDEIRYNPVGYHLGTVWPHDNALIAAGFRKYGFDDEAEKVFLGLIDAGLHFEESRFPELFAGFPRSEFRKPVNYPVACHPQAWSAASMPYLVQVLLGLVPDAFDRKLRIVRPRLPNFVRYLEIRRLKVGDAEVDLRFECRGGACHGEVLRRDGDLEVEWVGIGNR